MLSGSADHSIRLWDLKDKRITQAFDVHRPAEHELFKYKDMAANL